MTSACCSVFGLLGLESVSSGSGHLKTEASVWGTLFCIPSHTPTPANQDSVHGLPQQLATQDLKLAKKRCLDEDLWLHDADTSDMWASK